MLFPLDLSKSSDPFQSVMAAAKFGVEDYAALAALINSMYQGTAVFDAGVTAFSANMKSRSRDNQRRV